MSLDSNIAFVALGANLEDPARQIETAMAELSSLPETRLLKRSGFYVSKPLGYTDQPDYVNAVVMLDTSLSPHRLLSCLLDIEHRHGRKRTFRNSPRTLDLDVLLYGNQLLDEPGLRIPHPRMHERGFVLLPLAEISSDTLVPGHGRIADMLANVDIDAVHLLT